MQIKIDLGKPLVDSEQRSQTLVYVGPCEFVTERSGLLFLWGLESLDCRNSGETQLRIRNVTEATENKVEHRAPVLGPVGMLAREATGMRFPLMVLRSDKGFYLGTVCEEGPLSRESLEYWPTETLAKAALDGVEGRDWTQRTEVG